MTTTRTHAAPWTLRRLMSMLIAKPARKPQPAVLSGREATARHLYGEACQWSKLDMAEYDNSPLLRGGWLAEADRRIAGKPISIPDLLVLKHWGYTPDQWRQLPAIVKVDKRESYYAARGLGA